MDMKIAVIVFGLLLASGHSNVLRTGQHSANNLEHESKWWDGLTANLNNYIDATIQRLIPFFQQQGLDLFLLPDIDETFKVKPLLITYNGRLTLENGNVRGLINLSRYGNQEAFYNNKQLRLRLQIQLSDINIYYRYWIRAAGIGPAGDLNGNLDRLIVVADVLVDFNTDEISLLEFALTDRGTLSVRVSDNWLTDWLVNPLLSSFIKNVDDQILDLVETEIRNVLITGIRNVNNTIRNTIMDLETQNLIFYMQLLMRNALH